MPGNAQPPIPPPSSDNQPQVNLANFILHLPAPLVVPILQLAPFVPLIAPVLLYQSTGFDLDVVRSELFTQQQRATSSDYLSSVTGNIELSVINFKMNFNDHFQSGTQPVPHESDPHTSTDTTLAKIYP